VSVSSAERVHDGDGRQYHIGVAPGEIAPRVLLVGDPARADRIAERFETVALTRRCREYVTYTGTLGGKEITVLATGIGCDNMEIAMVELLACRRDASFIRVGSSGALQEDISVGDAVISTGAVRLESTSLGFVEEGYPAVAHHEVVLALISAANELGTAHHVGVTAAAAGFYGWQGRKGNIIEPRFPEIPARLAQQGVKNLEMETSTLFTIGSVTEVRTGAICTVFANRPANAFIKPAEKIPSEERAIDVAIRAFDYLDSMDGNGKPFTLPTP